MRSGRNRKQSIRRLLQILFPGGGRSRKSKNSMQLQRQGKPGQESAAAGSKGAQGAGKTAKKSGNIVEKTMDFVKSHPKGIIFLLIFAVLIMIVAGGLSSCSALFQGGGGAVIGSSFTAEDEDIIGANDDYKALETALRNRINGIEEEYPDMTSTAIMWMRSIIIPMN